MQKYDEDDPRNKPYEDKWDNLLFLILCILFILLLFLSLMPSKESRASTGNVYKVTSTKRGEN